MNRARATLIVTSTVVLPPLSARAQGAPSYKIGVTFPLTGPLAASSLLYVSAAQVAVDHINRAGGVDGHPLQLVVEDTQGTPEGGVAAMRKVVEVDGVQAVLSIYTNVVTAQIPLAQQVKVPFLCPAQAPNLMNKSAYSFAHAETIPETIDLYRQYWQKTRVKRLFQLLPNNAVGPYFSRAVKAAATRIGAQYAEATFDYNDTDFRGLASRVKEFHPDAIFLSAQGGITDTLVIKQLREAGLTVKIGVSGNFYEEPAWRAGVGTYADTLILSGAAIDPIVGKHFIDDYQIKTGHLPSAIAGEVYDEPVMIAAAIRSGSYSGAAIAAQLAVLKGVPSVLGGTITMDPDHYSPVHIALWRVRDGKLVHVTA
jgi:branched-chain amino acid transport system substrate-binding protein